MEYKYARYRQKGYNQALLAAGIEPDPNLVVTFPEINYELAIKFVSTRRCQRRYSDSLPFPAVPGPTGAWASGSGG